MKIVPQIFRIQDRLLQSIGGAPMLRRELLSDMLSPAPGNTTGYWLQLVIATLLATLGLALSSTAVVIGAMLVAPLMRPIVELAMGLATGSAVLAIRAALRIVASVVVVVVVAMLMTSALPFHEVTAELAARTAPSLLDLVVAGACALAAAYATLRSNTDIATTAAGTSIGISLVPPLCAAGYGLGIGEPAIFRGAALLFTANLSAILVVCGLVFALLGFTQLNFLLQPEADSTGQPATTQRIAGVWTRLAAKRLGPLARVLPPLLLLAAIYVPLQRAVGEITNRTQVRQAVARILNSDKRKVAQYSLEQNAADTVLRVVVVGDVSTAADLERELRQQLTQLGETNLRLSVWPVPTSDVVRALNRRIDELPPPAVPAEPEPPAVVLQRQSTQALAAIRATWPGDAAELITVSQDIAHPNQLQLVHLAAPLGPRGLQLLSKALENQLGPIVFTETTFAALAAPPEQGLAWVPEALAMLARLSDLEVNVCLTVVKAPPATRRLTTAQADTLTVHRLLAPILENPKLSVFEGTGWRLEVMRTACPTAPATALPSATPPMTGR